MRMPADSSADPIDPQFHAPSKSPSIVAIPRSPPPTSGTDPISSIPPGSRTDLPSEELKRRRTIAERMAKLGGIKFGAPPPVNRVQPSAGAPARPPEDLAPEESAIGLEQPAEAEEDEQDEQARRQRIAAKLAGMGGMRLGMLPIQPGVSSPPPPPIPVRREEESTPRSPPRAIAPPRQPATHYSESDQEYEHPSSSDDGVQVEAEESELEEVLHEDLEDEYVVETRRRRHPRSTRPPVPSARPPVPPTGRNPSIETPPVGARSGSFDTITSVPRAPAHQATSDFVMVEAEEAHFAPTAWPSRGPPPTLWTVPPPLESSDLGATGHWELPSIPSGSLDLGDSGLASDLSGSMWSEDSTAYPPAAQPSAASSSPPPTGAPPSLMGQSRAHAGVPARMTADDLRAVWNRVGAHVAEAAAGLLERSKRTLVGNGSYEGFIAEALAQVPNASLPHSPGEYGILIYAQTGAQVHTRLTDIMAGDVVVLEGAKLKGHKGLQSYSMSAGEGTPCMGVVSEFDAKKLKLKALQANQRVGQVVRTDLVATPRRCAESRPRLFFFFFCVL
ncbi:hypothetical protein F5148DRAFT_1236118 [Russula earlei]|uniref:Uncharacterized protein n=1 Tax=Russula earlei TaxID=71964 RepID=A0ACC0TXF4_9AGAM|nr:hypothetical protein F5148DRAFT_1236118 [Russula earlei]